MGNKIAYGLRELGVTKDHEYDTYSNARLREFRHQRIKWGFDERELFDLPYTLALFIYPRLLKFSQGEIHSVPPKYINGSRQTAFNAHLCTMGDPNPDCLTEEEWKEMINKMLFSFRYVIEEGNEGSKELMQLQREKKSDKEFFDRVNEGFMLFAQYFTELWD